MKQTPTKLIVAPSERFGKNYCSKCNTWFDDYFVNEVKEPRGEFWGAPCFETMYYRYCPECGADFDDGYIYDADDIYEDEDEEEE